MTEQTLESNHEGRPSLTAVPWPSSEARAVLDSMTEYFVAIDRAYRIAFVNRALERARPQGAPPLLGINLWDLWPEMRGTVVEESYERAFRLGLPVSFEYHHERSGFWVSATAYPQGDLLHVFFKDVTQAKRAEADRLEREGFLGSMVDSIPQIAWAMDLGMAPTHLNRRWHEYTGLPEGSAFDAAATVHPDDLPGLARLWEEARGRGEGLQAEGRLRRHDGQYRWHLIRVEPRREGGRVVGWFGTSTDVHDMRSADERLASTTDAVPAFIAFIDADLVYRFCNRRYQEWFGRPLDGIVGRHIREIVGETSFERLRPHLELAMSGQRTEYEQWLEFLQGRRFMRATYTPAFDAEGRVHGVNAMIVDETEARLAQEALGDARARTEGILASADVATWVLDVPNDRVYADRNLARMFGADEAMANGGPSGEYVARMHPDDRERVGAALAAAMVDGLPYDVEYRIASTGRWVTARGIPERDEDGRVVRLPGVVVDVTRQKEAEAALRESSERFRLLVESVPEIAWTARPDGYLDYYNERWYAYTGRQRGEGGDESWKPLLHPDDLDGTNAAWSRSVATGRPYEIELRLREAATGDFRWFLARARPLRDAEGRIVRWFGITSDIDEQKRAQRSLAFLVELEDRLRPLDDPAAMMQTAAQMLGESLGVDRCAYAEVEEDEDHFTIQGDSTRGDTVSIVGRFAMADFGARALALHRKGETFVVDDADRDVDDAGEREAYRVTQIKAVVSVPLLKNGRFAAGMAVHQRTPRRWSPEEIELVRMVVQRCWAHIEQTRLARAVQDELEAKVRARTMDLQASNDALRSFTYHVSHDLRAPLRGIASASRIVQEDYEDVLPDEAVELLDRQAEAATKLGRLIDDLLRLSRLSSRELEKAPLDLSAMAREAGAEASSLHPDTTVVVVVEDGLSAMADPSLLRLALGNLVENAVKYSPNGGTVRVGRQGEGAFFVSDEGIGIDPRYFGKIFEPFQRLHLDSEFAGTGIGLSNVRQVVERHGGRVWVESEPGKGSTFLFTLG